MPRATDETFDVAEDGTLTDRRRAAWLWDQLKLYAGGQVRIRISRPKRSTAANAYYWGVVLAAIREAMMDAGHPVSAEALHHHFKALYLEPRWVQVFHYTHMMPPTTTDLDQTAFAEYIESIKQDQAVLALGVYIPEPDAGYDAFRSYKIAEMIS